ncbi:Transposon Ty3-G Gag-Pol polyprotein [Rhizoctonia solani]|uniref:Transposon Ty3-G Gag-Pol polyprotein n=1 Tax=Rhizoctonia solani TaxID=456999 RepID=A0A8H8NRW0_9AGAM|nr:Transposon Ty3-G Gag-Pol polyprotein [Rhizoctonia solani]QRW18769.1 Transposon Ty3-G Gag-Pol polyprotein [Rhizoctonia solani]
MSRQLRSGRSYDASKEPQVPKRKTRQRKAAGAKADANEQALETNSKQLIVPRERERLTFGTAPGERNPRESVHIVGTGRRRGVALVGNDAVKLSLSAYAALTNRAPPIRRVLSWPTPAIETRMIADAPKEGEAAVPRNAEAAVRVPGEQELTPGGTDRAPAAVRAPETPSTNMRRKDTSSDNDVYVTARTSRVCDESIVLDSEGEPLLAQYVVNDDTSKTPSVSSEQRKCRRRKSKGNMKDPIGSPSNESKSTANYEGLTWDEEVRRVNGKDPGGPNTSLPDISKWVNPDWSRSGYVHESNEQSAGTDGESVQVNALIFKVDDNYVYDDDEYLEVLRNLRNQDRSESTHSQSRGAGPLQARQTHRVTVEEIDEETETTETSRTRSYVGKGKGKKKPRERSRKRKRPSLGMALDDLEGSRGERGRPTVSREPSVTYRGGGYLEGLIKTVPRGDRGGARDKPTTRSRRTNPPPSTVELPAPLHGQGGDGELPHTGTPGSDSEPSNSDSSDSDYSSTNKSISSRSTGMTRQQASRELEDIVRKLRKQNKRLEKKIVTQARSGYKAQTPKAYKGEADINKYDMFIFNYKLYLSDTKLSDRKAVLTVSQFLEDKAATWYMMNVAPDPEAYTMETIYVGLYEYCFPPDFKEEVRRQYNQKRQGDLSVQDYFAELARLCRRLRDIDNRQHVLRIWEGAAQYIKVEWALKYMQPETTDIETLREAALAAERAHKIKQKIERLGNDKGNPQKERSRSPPRKNDRRPNYRSSANGSNGRNRDHRSGSYNGNGNRTDKRQDKNRHKTQEGGRKEANTRKEKLTNEERDRLKAAGLCYVCQRLGHLARDCPKFHKARPSHIRANAVKIRPKEKVQVLSVMLKELDKLTRLRDRVEVNAVCVGQKNNATTKHIERNAVKIKDNTRKVPDTLVVEAKIEGKSVRVLLDSGCQTDLILSTLVDQLKLDKTALTKPLQVQLAMAGSRGTLHYGAQARIEYQTVNKNRAYPLHTVTITSRTPPRSSSRATTHAGRSYPTHTMATRSRPPSRARSPVDQGQLGPDFPPASPELGEVSLERVICLLWGLQSQVDRIEQTLSEQNKISREVCTNVENISQAVNVVKDGLAQLQLPRGPHTPEDQKPPAVEETPRAAPKAEPIGKAQPFLGAPAPIISTGAPRRDPLLS